ncbi:MAG: LysR family transcriptional regulator [Geminicoccaceae bacterium]
MDLHGLRILLAVADHRSFAKAGREVGLTPSAISLQIKKLEDALNVSVLDRSRRPPTLTARGGALVDEAREIVGRFDDLARRFGDDQTTRTLALGAVPTSVTGLLPPGLARLQAVRPTIQLLVETGLSHELEQAVVAGLLDAALVSKPEALREGLVLRDVAHEPLMVIAPIGLRGRTAATLLQNHPFIRFKRFAWASRLIDQTLRAQGIHVQAAMEIDSLEGICTLVGHGLGVSIVPRRRIADPFPDNIRTISFGEPPVIRTLSLIMRADRKDDPLVVDLGDALLTAAQV